MKIAIVGAGISGLSALWAIQKYSDHDVELYEKEDRIGGDACTIPFKIPGKKEFQVDLAFLLFNMRGWPNLCKLFTELGVETRSATATYSFSGDNGQFEWSSHSLRTVLGKWINLLNPNVWRMMWDICRFNVFATDILARPSQYEHFSISSFLQAHGYSRAFAESYLLPFLGTMWPASLSNIAQMSILRAVEALHAAGLLQLWNRLPWYCVQGGSSEYLKKIVQQAPERVHTRIGVESVTTLPDGGVDLGLVDGSTKRFNHVILAVPSGAVRKLLKAGGCLPTELDNVLQRTSWTAKELIAHFDKRLMPRDRADWSGWNATLASEESSKSSKAQLPPDQCLDSVSCTFSYNKMLDLDVSEYGHIIVTVNPHVPIDPKKIIHRQHFVQPSAALTAPSAMRKLEDPTWVKDHVPPGVDFAGAWQGLGYHEDGLISAFKALRRIGVAVPDWESRVPPLPQLFIGDRIARGAIRAGEGMRGVLAPVYSVLAWIMVFMCQMALALCHQLGWEKKTGDIEWIIMCWAGPDAYKWAS